MQRQLYMKAWMSLRRTMMRNFEDLETDDRGDADDLNITHCQGLLKDVNLKDLIDGKDVVFKINEDYDGGSDYLNESDEDDVGDCEIKSSSEALRTMRGAPNTSFRSIESSMVNVDDEGYVKKEIVLHGHGVPPPDHSRVLVHYNFYKEFDEVPFDSTYLRGCPCRMRLSQGEIIPGLEMAIKSMKKGENSRFLIKWQVAFGRQGCPPRINKECDIFADVTLLEFQDLSAERDGNALTEEEADRVDFEQSMKEARNYHFSGCELFASGDIRGGIKKYKKSVGMLNEMRVSSDLQESLMLKLKVKGLVNLSICYNKIGRYEQACIACRDALSIEPNNVKAVFQYGRANLNLSQMTAAEKWLKKAKQLKPDDEDINRELDKLHLKKKTIELEDTLFCRRALGNSSVPEDRKK